MRTKFIAIIFYFFTSCGQPDSLKSNLNVVNGIVTTNYPEVVYIKSNAPNWYEMCTGTFIRKNLLLTAAHCVESSISVEVAGHVSTKILANNSYFDLRDNSNTFDYLAHDIALVKFDKNVSATFIDIATTRIANGDKLTLVGFGLNDYSTGQGKGTKRVGYNSYVLNSYLNKGIINFEGRYSSVNGASGDGTRASVGQLDSGGPLIVEGKGIVGVVSGQSHTYNNGQYGNSSYYADLGHTVAKNFFDHAKSLGYFDAN